MLLLVESRRATAVHLDSPLTITVTINSVSLFLFLYLKLLFVTAPRNYLILPPYLLKNKLNFVSFLPLFYQCPILSSCHLSLGLFSHVTHVEIIVSYCLLIIFTSFLFPLLPPQFLSLFYNTYSGFLIFQMSFSVSTCFLCTDLS